MSNRCDAGASQTPPDTLHDLLCPTCNTQSTTLIVIPLSAAASRQTRRLTPSAMVELWDEGGIQNVMMRMWWWGTQERSSGPCTSQATRYCWPRPLRQTSRILHTVNAGWLSMIQAGGGASAGGVHSLLEETGLIWDTWKVEWIMNLGASFLWETFKGMSLADSRVKRHRDVAYHPPLFFGRELPLPQSQKHPLPQ